MTAINGIDYNSYYALQSLSNEQGYIQAQDGSIWTTEGYAVSPSGETCTDGKDDGKIGFFGAIGNIFKGAVKTAVNAVKGCFFDQNGNFSLGRTLTTVAVGAACVACPAIGVALGAVGVASGAAQLGSGVITALGAQTDAEAKEAWQNVGGGALIAGVSFAGAKASYAKVGNVIKNGTGTAMNSTKGMGILGKARTVGRNCWKSVKVQGDTFSNAFQGASGGFFSKVSAGFKSAKSLTLAPEAYTQYKADTEKAAKPNSKKADSKPKESKPAESKPQETKTAQPEAVKSDDAMIAEAKARNLENQQQPASTPENAHSPQAEIYETSDKIDLTEADRVARGKAQSNKFYKRYNIEPSEPQAQPAAQSAETSNPFKLTGKQSQTLNNLSKSSQSEVADWIYKNQDKSGTNLFKAVDQMYTQKFGSLTTPAQSTATAAAETTAATAKATNPFNLTGRQLTQFNSLQNQSQLQLEMWLKVNKSNGSPLYEAVSQMYTQKYGSLPIVVQPTPVAPASASAQFAA